MSWAGGAFGERGRCVLAPNADAMTLDGTNTWVLREPGARRSVVVDPGPSIVAHLDAVAGWAEAEGSVGVVLLTHHHLDHSEAARELAERLGCGVRALDPALRLGSEGLGDGDVVEVDGLEVRVVATPGHTADSLSFHLPAEDVVLTGDTVLGRGTTVVAHPDGELGAYLDSLDRLHALCSEHGVGAVWPGHGPVIDDALGALELLPRAPPRPAGPGGGRPGRPRAPRERGGAADDALPRRWSRSSTPTSTRCCGAPPSSPCGPSWPTSPPADPRAPSWGRSRGWRGSSAASRIRRTRPRTRPSGYGAGERAGLSGRGGPGARRP